MSEGDVELKYAASAEQQPRRRLRDRVVESLVHQRLQAWQPVLTPSWILGIVWSIGLSLVIIGGCLGWVNKHVVECEVEYFAPLHGCSDVVNCTERIELDITGDTCAGLSHTAVIEPPVFLYYRLTRFYQNHRQYVKSRNNDQLSGEIIENPDDLQSCAPAVMWREDPSKVLLPCGLASLSVFNDSLAVQDAFGVGIGLDDSAGSIAWPEDVNSFHNPPSVDATKVLDWLNPDIFPGKMENGHFIVWMRPALLPDFRKLYARIDEAIHLPVRVIVSARFPVTSFNGRKFIILAQTSWAGGRSFFLSIAYIVVGVICIVFGILLSLKSIRKPRLFGDIKHLNKLFRSAEYVD